MGGVIPNQAKVLEARPVAERKPGVLTPEFKARQCASASSVTGPSVQDVGDLALVDATRRDFSEDEWCSDAQTLNDRRVRLRPALERLARRITQACRVARPSV
jgi:hypothetical protein